MSIPPSPPPQQSASLSPSTTHTYSVLRTSHICPIIHFDMEISNPLRVLALCPSSDPSLPLLLQGQLSCYLLISFRDLQLSKHHRTHWRLPAYLNRGSLLTRRTHSFLSSLDKNQILHSLHPDLARYPPTARSDPVAGELSPERSQRGARRSWGNHLEFPEAAG